MKLVIAEKPSVAQSLATVLGAKEKKDDAGGDAVPLHVGHGDGFVAVDIFLALEP